MLIYLIRHGEAERPDPDKPKSLTQRGKVEVTRVAEALLQKGVKADALWHSPKKRAIQTAEIIQKAMGLPAKVLEEKEGLKPGGDADEVLREILGERPRRLLIVSHLPFLPNLAALLLEGGKKSPSLLFPTAGVCAFEGDKTFKLLWNLSPGDLG